MQVIRRPGGAWEKLPGGGQGRQVWKNTNGRRTLTNYGRQVLSDFQDLTVQIPVTEYEFENDTRGWHLDPRETWYPVSENSMPGMLAALQDSVPLAYVNRLENL